MIQPNKWSAIHLHFANSCQPMNARKKLKSALKNNFYAYCLKKQRNLTVKNNWY